MRVCIEKGRLAAPFFIIPPFKDGRKKETNGLLFPSFRRPENNQFNSSRRIFMTLPMTVGSASILAMAASMLRS